MEMIGNGRAWLGDHREPHMTIQIQQGDAVHLTESSTSHTDTVKSEVCQIQRNLTDIKTTALRESNEPPMTAEHRQWDSGYSVESFTSTVRRSNWEFVEFKGTWQISKLHLSGSLTSPLGLLKAYRNMQGTRWKVRHPPSDGQNSTWIK